MKKRLHQDVSDQPASNARWNRIRNAHLAPAKHDLNAARVTTMDPKRVAPANTTE